MSFLVCFGYCLHMLSNKALILRQASMCFPFSMRKYFVKYYFSLFPGVKYSNHLASASSFGRFLAGWLSDSCGRFNTVIVTTFFTLAIIYGTWAPISFTHSQSLLYLFSAIFGLGSGSIISLAPVCFGQLCKVDDYGKYYGTAYSVVSFA